MSDPYRIAQAAIAELKSAVRLFLESAGESGATNAMIGRSLGIYAGHVGHEGHVSRTILGLLEAEGIVVQDAHSKIWKLRRFAKDSE